MSTHSKSNSSLFPFSLPHTIRRFAERYRSSNVNAWIVFFLLIYVILAIRVVTFDSIDDNLFFGAYSLAIVTYLLSRFLLAYLYKPELTLLTDPHYEPTVTFCVPVKNEGDHIRETILKIVASDYPKDKLDIVAINDGSTDNTLEEMRAAKVLAELEGVKIDIVHWEKNRGKRHGMAECVRRSRAEILVFIDSDSFVDPDAAKELVKYFVDPKIAAVTGHTYVANVEQNILTKMQSVRYYVSFRIMKSAEAIFGAVTCCSGCCSAYRRSHVLEVLGPWLSQTFLGVPCTYGDDRSLTNYVLLKGYKAIYAPEAKARTFVPDTLQKYTRQQLRWKKSWTRESFKIGILYMWKRNPILSISFYLSLILPLLAPIVAVRALIWYPIAVGGLPWYYIGGLLLMAYVYGMYYYIYTRDKRWSLGVLSISFYALLLIWQLPWAIITLRDARWGTR